MRLPYSHAPKNVPKLKTALKIAWLGIAILSTLLVCIEGSAAAYYLARRILSGDDRADAFVRTQVARMPRDSYPNSADQTWFAPYWKEFRESTHASSPTATSYSNWHRPAFQGKYINVDRNGRRATWNQDLPNGQAPIQVALFGGATIWGTGARDEFTIPSYVSKTLAEKYPHRFHVVNYGQDQYVSTQEVVAFLREMQKDNVPDIVIFYDGYNDTFAAIQAGAAGIPLNEDDRTREFNLLHPSRKRDFYFEALSRTNTFQLMRGLQNALWPRIQADSLTETANDELARDVVRAYFRNVEFVTAMEKEFGFTSRFFWQPSVYTRARPTEPEKSIIRGSPQGASFYRRVHEAMKETDRAAGPANFTDISGVLDGSAATAFIDATHSTELANQVIAHEMVADLEDTLEQAASRARR
jgi:lysophospholipase L1-like esterase